MLNKTKFYGLILIVSSLSTSLAYGQNGRPGDPGVDGANGQNAGYRFIYLPEEAVIEGQSFQGVAGTAGFHGGSGIDLNGDGVALGGYGGNGGEGESLEILNQVLANRIQVSAVGGAGAEAGKGGTSIGAPPRTGGYGGSGGLVRISGSASESLDLQGVGGVGAEGFGYGRRGGLGGAVNVSASLQDYVFREEIPIATSLGRAYGGQGGVGRKFAAGGHGGSATVGLLANQLGALALSTDSFAYGGHGGDSEGNHGGHGGDGLTSITWLKPLNETPYPTDAFHGLYSQGGNGGRSFTNGIYVGNGGDGGNANFSNSSSLWAAAPAITQLQIRAVGGSGGDVLGAGATNVQSAVGGMGGGIINPELILDQRVTGGTQALLQLDVEIAGGNGGNNLQGRGGHGGVVDVDRPFPLATEGDVQSRVVATGGNGGVGYVSGDGGNAEVYLNYGNPVIVNASLFGGGGHNLESHLEVSGGNAGMKSSEDGYFGDGGSALARQQLRGTGTVELSSHATGGRGVQGGSTDARALGISTGEDAEYHVQASAVADGSAYNLTMQRAGDAVATAESQAVGGNAYADADAIGAWGLQRSGASTATATAMTVTGQEAVARSHSSSRADRDRTSVDGQNYAKSTSVAQSSNEANSQAQATAQGHFSFGSSLATATGSQAIATATVNTQTLDRGHQASLTTQVYGSGFEVSSLSEMGFRTNVMDPVSLHERTAEVDVYARYSLESGRESLTGIEASLLADQFDLDGDIDVFQAGELAFTSDGERYVATTTLQTQQTIDYWEVDHSLYAFIYDVEGVEGGFASAEVSLLSSGNTVFDVTFNDLASLQAGLNDQAWYLGEFAVNELLDLQLQVTVDGNFDGSFLSFRTAVVGADPVAASFTAVPEPATVPLALLVMGVFGLRRRARSTA